MPDIVPLFTKFLKGKVALVTGSGQGNGLAIAHELAKCGADLVLNDIDADRLEQARREIESHDVRVTGITADCAQVAQTDALVGQTIERLGRLDVLVNNAGLIKLSAFPNVPETEYDAIMNLNARGAYFLMQAAAPHLPRGGRIINIASVAGVDGRTLSPPYAASKAALIAMTKTLARNLASKGITVNAIAPGMFDTPFVAMLDDKLGVQQQGLSAGEFTRRRAADIPLGRLGKPEEIGRVVAFLASSAADYITGETIILSGGWVID
jgi:NAD(P)-dependent dehydrogenase (short-subunit alcohol dehydrogenase family)